jgi:hypothetical protein
MIRRTFLRHLPAWSAVAARPEIGTQAVPPAEPDRAYWVQLLTKLADPVLTALAADELRQRMPVEARPGVTDRPQVTHLEAVGRLLAGIGPWLASTGTDEPELRSKYLGLASQALANAVNPKAKDFLNFTKLAQPLVDAAFLAQGLLRCPVLWSRASETTKGQLLAALRSTRAIKPGFNNWLLFSGMIEAFFAAVGEEYDRMRLDYALRQHEQWYVGDGAYGDGPDFHWDFYNSYVIQPFLTDILRVLVPLDKSYAAMQARVEKIARRYAAVQERLIAPDGSFPVLGRSICYRAGAFHHLANAAFRGLLPSDVPPAQVRSALTAVLHRTLDVPGTFDANGWLQIGLAGHQPDLAETYISTGSLYLTATALLPLGLPGTDPFWRGPTTNWTSRKAWGGANLPADHALHL